MDINETYDVVVVGGGAAGLSAALVLGRSRRSVLVVDAGEPRNAPAEHLHNYLGREGVTTVPTADTTLLDASTMLNAELILEETAAAVSQHRKDAA